MKQVILVNGGGGQGRDVLDALWVMGLEVIGVLDDALGAEGDPRPGDISGVPILGNAASWREHARPDIEFALGTSNQLTRLRLAEEMLAAGAELCRVTHPKATVSRTARLGRGVVLLAGCVIGPDATIGDVCILNANCAVDHDGVLGTAVQFGPGVTLAGGITIGDGSFLGVGATVMPGLTIGRNAVVGAGAVVIRNVADGATVVGNPAKPIAR